MCRSLCPRFTAKVRCVRWGMPLRCVRTRCMPFQCHSWYQVLSSTHKAIQSALDALKCVRHKVMQCGMPLMSVRTRCKPLRCPSWYQVLSLIDKAIQSSLGVLKRVWHKAGQRSTLSDTSECAARPFTILHGIRYYP